MKVSDLVNALRERLETIDDMINKDVFVVGTVSGVGESFEIEEIVEDAGTVLLVVGDL